MALSSNSRTEGTGFGVVEVAGLVKCHLWIAESMANFGGSLNCALYLKLNLLQKVLKCFHVLVGCMFGSKKSFSFSGSIFLSSLGVGYLVNISFCT